MLNTIHRKKNIFLMNVQQNKYYYIITLFILTVYSWYYSYSFVSYQSDFLQTVPCVADVIVFNMENWISGYIGCIVILLVISMCIKNDFKGIYVLAFKRRLELWNLQVCEMLFLAFIFALYYSLCTILFSKYFYDTLINWNSMDSVAFLAIGSVLKEQFLSVLIYYYFGLLLYWIEIMMVYLLLKWTLYSSIGAFLGTLILHVLQVFIRGKGFSNIAVSINYQYWKNNSIILNFILAIVIILIVYGMGKRLSTKREFMNEKD